MSDKRFELKLPCGIVGPMWPLVNVTLADCAAIRAQLDKIERQAKQREWRDGDVVKSKFSDCLYVRVRTNRWNLCVDVRGHGTDDLTDPEVTACGTFLFNIPDLLASGPVVVGLTEDEADGKDRSVAWLCALKIRAALDAYRKGKQ